MKMDIEQVEQILTRVVGGYREHFEEGHDLDFDDFAFSLPAVIAQVLESTNWNPDTVDAARDKFVDLFSAGAERYRHRCRPGKDLH
ncbi:hypothetical protein [Microbulbifer sp. ALW1]|uniref:hypothetical protein n=1 Tax=Microbulbifer sp. (strain ALW1) TaxID=1516059 RepID=UPI001358D4E5|nr:hypothetical protein [Microbulbifer sp. ALW1]